MDDESIMPIGTHKGKLLRDVPASWFHWTWHEWLRMDRSHKLHQYVLDSWEALLEETPNLEWDEA